MRSRAAFLLFVLLLVVPGGPAWADKRVALVIGNSAYQNVAKLTNPANDAAAVAAMFRAAKFEVVESKRDLSNAEMRRTLRDFADKGRDADLAVVYYAGHGIEIDGMNYLLPVDVLLERDSDAYDEAITLDRVLQVIEPVKKLRLVILDACRDNPFARTMKRAIASRALGRGLAGVEPGKPNTLIAFAAKGGSTADDGAGTNSPFTTALLKHLTTPGLDLRKAFGLIRDDVIKATGNKQEPFVYGSLGGTDVSLVPVAPVSQAVPTQPSADPQAGVRKDYEFALQINTRDGWDSFLAQYPSGFYANLAKAQLNKIAAEEAQRTATDKARQAEAERTRLANEGAKASEQAKASRDAKAAKDAHVEAERQRQAEQAKADAAERTRASAERGAAEKLAKEKAETEAKAVLERAQLDAKAIRDKAEADAKAAEDARKMAEKEPERSRVAALPLDAGRTTLTSQELNRALQAELRRVGCQTGSVSDEWSSASRHSLELFNKHAGMKLEAQLASLDALDAVKGKQARICPLICEHGFHANGERCEKIVCRAGFAVGDDNTCEKVEPKRPVAKRPAPTAEPKRAGVPPKTQASQQQLILCYGSATCRPVKKGCRIEGSFGGQASVSREVCD